jgi:hypothetical protein
VSDSKGPATDLYISVVDCPVSAGIRRSRSLVTGLAHLIGIGFHRHVYSPALACCDALCGGWGSRDTEILVYDNRFELLKVVDNKMVKMG